MGLTYADFELTADDIERMVNAGDWFQLYQLGYFDGRE